MEPHINGKKVCVRNCTKLKLMFLVEYGQSHASYTIDPEDYQTFESTINQGSTQTFDFVKKITVSDAESQDIIISERDFSSAVPGVHILQFNLQVNQTGVLEWIEHHHKDNEEHKDNDLYWQEMTSESSFGTSFNTNQHQENASQSDVKHGKKKVYVIQIPNLRDQDREDLDDSYVYAKNNERIRAQQNLAMNQGINRRSLDLVQFDRTLGTGEYNPMQLFLDHFIIGSESQKVDFFKQLADNNETLLNLISRNQVDLDEFNKIIDFLRDLEDEEVQEVLKSILIHE